MTPVLWCGWHKQAYRPLGVQEYGTHTVHGWVMEINTMRLVCVLTVLSFSSLLPTYKTGPL